MTQNHLFHSSLITPSNFDLLRLRGLTSCRSMWYFQICCMNLVVCPVCSPAPLHTTLSGILNSEMNCFNPCLAMDLDSMGYMAVKKSSVANTCGCLFPSRDLRQASIASVKMTLCSHGCSYILSALYHCASGIVTDCSNHWVVAFIVFVPVKH